MERWPSGIIPDTLSGPRVSPSGQAHRGRRFDHPTPISPPDERLIVNRNLDERDLPADRRDLEIQIEFDLLRHAMTMATTSIESLCSMHGLGSHPRFADHDSKG